jgi:PAS domain S-box-containing protein
MIAVPWRAPSRLVVPSIEPEEWAGMSDWPGDRRVMRLVADDQGNYVEVNDAALETLGYSREELLSLSVWDLTPGGNELDGLRLWQQFIRQGEQSGEYVLRTRRGGLVKFHYRARANVEPGRHESLLTLSPPD